MVHALFNGTFFHKAYLLLAFMLELLEEPIDSGFVDGLRLMTLQGCVCFSLPNQDEVKHKEEGENWKGILS